MPRVSKEEFEEAICFLRAVDAVVKHDLRELDMGNPLTAATVASTARFMRSISADILKLLKEEEPRLMPDLEEITKHAECLEKATEIAKALNQNVYVQKMMPVHRGIFAHHHPRWVIFFETDAWISGQGVTPEGKILEVEEYT